MDIKIKKRNLIYSLLVVYAVFLFLIAIWLNALSPIGLSIISIVLGIPYYIGAQSLYSNRVAKWNELEIENIKREEEYLKQKKDDEKKEILRIHREEELQ